MRGLAVGIALMLALAAIAPTAAAQEAPSLERARNLFDAGQLDAARDDLNALVRAGSDDPGVFLLLGVVERSRGQYGSAITSLRTAQRMDPLTSSIAIELATTLAWADDLATAEALYRQVLQREPDNPGARSGLGFALAWQGKLDEAGAIFDRLLAQDPANASAWLGAGYVARARLNREAALTAYSRALALDPGNAEAQAALEGIRWDRRTEVRAVAGITRVSGREGTEGRIGLTHAISPKVTVLGATQRYVFGAADPLLGGVVGDGVEEWGVEGGVIYRPTRRATLAVTLNTFFSEDATRGIASIEGIAAATPRLSLLVGLRPSLSSAQPERSLSGAIGGTLAVLPRHQVTARAFVPSNTTYEPRLTGLLNYSATPSPRLILQGGLAHAEDDRFGFTSYSFGVTYLVTPGFGISVDGNHRQGSARRSTLLAGVAVRF